MIDYKSGTKNVSAKGSMFLHLRLRFQFRLLCFFISRLRIQFRLSCFFISWSKQTVCHKQKTKNMLHWSLKTLQNEVVTKVNEIFVLSIGVNNLYKKKLSRNTLNMLVQNIFYAVSARKRVWSGETPFLYKVHLSSHCLLLKHQHLLF